MAATLITGKGPSADGRIHLPSLVFVSNRYSTRPRTPTQRPHLASPINHRTSVFGRSGSGTFPPATDFTSTDADAVVAAARRGEEWALTELFRTFQPPLLRYLRAREPTAADDVAAEAWLAVARRLRDFVGDGNDVRYWLFTIARNRLSEHRRRAARRKTEPEPIDLLERRVETGVATDAGDFVVERLSAQEAVHLLVEGLSPVQAEVVLLRVVAGLSVDDVARMLNRSRGSVRVLQHRALRRLASRFSVTALTE